MICVVPQRFGEPSPPLFGRAREIKGLRALLDQAAAGHGGVAVVEGEAGIGKTRLVRAAVGQGAAGVFQAFHGRGEELEQRRPFGLIADVLGLTGPSLGGRRAELAALLGTAAPASPSIALFTQAPGIEHRLTEGFLSLFEDLAAEAPVLLLVDDTQWADLATLVVLHRLVGRVEDLPLALVTIRRPLPRRRDVDRFVEAALVAGAEHVSLGPLDGGAVADLVRALGGDRQDIIERATAAGGNPLFVQELVHALLDEGPPRQTRVESHSSFPSSLRLAILRRLGYLSDDALLVLRIASVLGSTFSVTDLSAGTGRSTADLMAALDESLRAGFLQRAEEKLVFRHDVLREALYHDLAPAVRRALHLDVARGLAVTGAPSSQIAEHFFRAAQRGDRQAVEWLVRAAREAAPRAPTVAADRLGQALQLVADGGPERDSLLAERAACLLLAGEVDGAERISREILSRAHEPAAEGIARWCLVASLMASARTAEAVAEAEVAAASTCLSAVDRLRVAAWGAHGQWLEGDRVGGRRTAAAVVAAADAIGDPVAGAAALAALAGIEMLEADYDVAVDLMNRAIRLADMSPGREGHRFQLHLFRGSMMLELDRMGDAIREFKTGLRTSDEIGASWNIPLYHFLLELSCYWSGQWDDACAEFETGLELARRYGVGHTTMARSVRALIAIRRGDLRVAEDLLAAAEEALAATGPEYRGSWVAWTRSLLLEAQGQDEAAAAMLTDVWRATRAAGVAFDYPVLGPDVIRLARSGGDGALVEDVLAAVEGVLADNPQIATVRGCARWCRGLAGEDPEVLLDAVRILHGAPRLIDRALASADAGDAFQAHGHRAEAVHLFEQALRMFQTLGAERGVVRTAARLRALGVKARYRRQSPRPRFGWEALTPTELKVAGYVAEGLSNPRIAEQLFLSRYTVQTHVSHALTKLDLSSRVELAGEVVRRRAGGAW